MGTHTLCTARLALITLTSLPLFVTFLLRDMPALWRHPHRLVFWWLIVMQALFTRARSDSSARADARAMHAAAYPWGGEPSGAAPADPGLAKIVCTGSPRRDGGKPGCRSGGRWDDVRDPC